MRTAVALFALLAATPAWGRPRPEPCPVGRFLTADGAHVVADVASPASETIVLEPTSITIDPACERVTYRIATRVDAQGAALTSPALNVAAVCSGITFYGQFLQQLGFCNPQTDVLTVFGGAELRPHASGVQQAPAGVGTVTFTASPTGVTAMLAGTALRTDEHSLAILLVDAATGKPVPLDYGFATARTTDPSGLAERVSIPFDDVTPPASVRAYLMVDAYPAAVQTLSAP